jgi:hypothetical protein
MKVFTIAYIRSWNPCYDPKKYLAETWQGTALDILNRAEIPMADKLLVVLRTDLVSERIMRLFAVWCARQYQQTDQRCIDALLVAERFANGEATSEELSAAESARSAAWSAQVNKLIQMIETEKD